MQQHLLCAISSSVDAELCLRYWAQGPNGDWQDSLDAISQAFDLSSSEAKNRVSATSIAYASNIRCPHCGVPASAKTREQYELLHDAARHTCTCERKRSKVSRNDFSTDRRTQVIDDRINFIESELIKSREKLGPIDYGSLDPIGAFYLCCILQASGSLWQDSELPPVTAHCVELAPTNLLVEKMYNELRSKQVLVPSLRSPIHAFNIGEAGNSVITFNVARVAWTMAEDANSFSRLELYSMVRSRIQSISLSAQKDLRKILIEHELLALILECMEGLKIRSSSELELHLLVLVRNILRNVWPRLAAPVIKVSFLDHRLRRALKLAQPEEIAELVSTALMAEIDKVVRIKNFEEFAVKNKHRMPDSSSAVISDFYRGIFEKEN